MIPRLKLCFATLIFFCPILLKGQEKPKMERIFSISSTTAVFGAEGGTHVFTVTSSDSWNISTETQYWGHLTKKGNILSLKVDAYDEEVPRTDSFVLTSGDKNIRVNIKQEGRISLSVSNDNLSFSSAGGTKNVTITTNGTWYISSETVSWCHLTKNGNIISVRTDPYNGSSSRSDWFSVKAGNNEKRIYITQSPSSSTNLSVSSNNLSFGDSGGVQTITVTTNRSWNIGTSTASWGHLTKNGNQLSVRIDPFSGDKERTDWFTIKAGDKEIRVYITQKAGVTSYNNNSTINSVSNSIIDYLYIDGSSANKTTYFASSGDRQYYSVRTNASSFDIWGVPYWCSVENKTKDGFTLVCSSNPNKYLRSDYFKVKAAGKEIRIDINQYGKTGGGRHNKKSWLRIGLDVNMDLYLHDNTDHYYYSDYFNPYNSYYGSSEEDIEMTGGIGLRARLGGPDNLLNMICGARYVFGNDKSGFLIPVILNFNLLSDYDIALYLGCGCEFSNTDYYENDAILQMGFCGNHADMQLFIKPNNEAIGLGFTYYF